MTPKPEHNVPPRTTSNPGGVGSSPLARACLEAGRPAGTTTLATLLRLALDEAGAERAFLASSADDGSGVGYSLQAAAGRRPGDPRPHPHGAIRRALSRAANPGPAASGHPRLHRRCIASAPVPVALPLRAAIVVESGGPRGAAELAERLAPFAALIGLVLRGGTGRRMPPPRTVRGGDSTLVGRSRAFRRMLDWIDRAAANDLPVLVRGESGTGKEAVSRRIHDRSRRSDGPFVALNCAAVSPTLIEAELFGALRGAYTGIDRDRPGLLRRADGGTLMLDEIGDMPEPMQAKLLRALQERRVRPVGGCDEIRTDVRVVAASHRDLLRRIADGRFRADLYYRLSVLEVRVPPLRERLEDLEELVQELTRRIERETGLPGLPLSPGAWQVLRGHGWPGNVRELHAVLARATLRAGSSRIDARDLRLHGALACPEDPDPSLERAMIAAALREAGGRVARAAAAIGWSRQKVYRRMRQLGLER